jgi:hypothetical protein
VPSTIWTSTGREAIGSEAREDDDRDLHRREPSSMRSVECATWTAVTFQMPVRSKHAERGPGDPLERPGHADRSVAAEACAGRASRPTIVN